MEAPLSASNKLSGASGWMEAAGVTVLPFLRRGCPLDSGTCLLYTSDAADEGLGVDLGGRRIIKKKKRGEGWREGVGGGARRQSGSERLFCFFFQAEDGIRDLVRSRGLGDVYKRQVYYQRRST